VFLRSSCGLFWICQGISWTLQLDQVAQSPVWPGLGCFQGWGISHLSGQSGPVPHHPQCKTFFPSIQSKPTLIPGTSTDTEQQFWCLASQRGRAVSADHGCQRQLWPAVVSSLIARWLEWSRFCTEQCWSHVVRSSCACWYSYCSVAVWFLKMTGFYSRN